MKEVEAFNVSVIIPSYNAEDYLKRAVDSVSELPEVLEILLVYDGSTDNTLQLCTKLSAGNQKIHLLHHENYANKGAAASRNLGIKNARAPYIAFLDADDYYLPIRFASTALVFASTPDADGVYECIGLEAEDEESYKKHMNRMMLMNYDIAPKDLSYTTVTHSFTPDNLFEALILGRHGWFHFNGLTLRRETIDKVGLIKDELGRFGEDDEFFIRLAIKSKLYAGNITSPVAIRCVYPGNITINTAQNKQLKYKTIKGKDAYLETVLSNIRKEKYSKLMYKIVLRDLVEQQIKKLNQFEHKWRRRLLKGVLYPFYLLKYPFFINRLI